MAPIFAVAGLLGSQTLPANNITIASEFTGDEPLMTAPVSCAFPEGNPYKILGTIQVDAPGTYQVFAASDGLTTAYLQGVPDFVLLVYEASFNPDQSSENLLLSIFRGEEIELETGTSYVLVAQYCADLNHPNLPDFPEFVFYYGPISVVMKGPGQISGAGVETPQFTWGTFSGVEDMIVPPESDDAYRYHASGPVPVTRSGNYFIGLVYRHPLTTFFTLLIYDGSFDPASPEQNLVMTDSGYGRVYLEGGHSYIFIAVDNSNEFDKSTEWQFVIFPPGPVRFNEDLTGAWVSPGIEGQGLMMHAGGLTQVLFLAWFTFQTAPVPIIPGPPPDLGSGDQRWLTGYGIMPEQGNTMNINFESSTGGVFNTHSPGATTNSQYGTGGIELVDCEHLKLSYSLPGGHQGELDYYRIISDTTIECAKHIYAGNWEPLYEESP